MFIASGKGMIGAADGIHLREVFAVASTIAAEHDHAFAGVIPRDRKSVV